jgi:ribosomal protein S18 acetylase RimI-like enzyme
MEVTVYPATEEEVRSGYVGRQLRGFNYGFVGEYPEVQYIRLNARDIDGQVVGGLRAVVAMYWLRVEVLWVSEGFRGNGIGSRLLSECEHLAVTIGAKNAALETFEWQAPSFYEKHGYEEAGRMENYIGGFYLSILRKPLVRDKAVVQFRPTSLS